MRQVSSFPDYNRFLTSLRWDELIKLGDWDWSSSHHQLEVPFSATNESHGIRSLVHSHTNFPIIRDSHYHLYSLTKEILSVCHIFCLECWKNLFVLDRTSKIKFWWKGRAIFKHDIILTNCAILNFKKEILNWNHTRWGNSDERSSQWPEGLRHLLQRICKGNKPN